MNTTISAGRLLIAQILYGLAGIAFNLLSLMQSVPLTPTDPIAGIFAMGVYLLGLVPGYRGYRRMHLAIMFAALLVFGYGGIALHAMAFAENPAAPIAYHSASVLLLALGINLIGFGLNLCSAIRGLRNLSPRAKNS